MELPKHIKDKIRSIVKHDNYIIGLINDINKWNPELDKPIKVLKEHWQWDLYFRGTYKKISQKEIESIILTALTGKLVEVEYPKQKTITLDEIRKNEGE